METNENQKLRELCTNKFIVGTSETPVTTQTTISDPAATATVTTTGANTGTSAAGLTLIGDTSTVNQAAALMNDLVALKEDITTNKTAIDANNAAIDSLIDRLQAFGLIS